MKYYLISTKNTVNTFLISNGRLIIKNKNKQLLLNSEILFNFTYDFFVKNNIIFSNQEIGCLTYDLKNQKFGVFENKSMLYFDGSELILLFVDSNENNKLYLFDYHKNSSKELIQNYNWEFLYLTSEILYVCHKTSLKSLSLLTGEYKWEVDLGLQGLEVGNILGISGENLIVVCKKEQKQQELLSLSVQSGKEVWRKNMQVSQYGFAFSEDKTSILYLYAGGLWLNGEQITRGHNIFREINTKDGSVRREGVLRQLDEAGLGVISYQLLGGFIYFRAVYQSFGDTVIGVLDYETLSLLWWEEVQIHSETGYFAYLGDMQVSENKIYALDKTGTLHIYQRDENVPFVKPTESGLVAFEDLPTEPEVSDLPTESAEEQDFSGLPF